MSWPFYRTLFRRRAQAVLMQHLTSLFRGVLVLGRRVQVVRMQAELLAWAP